MGRLPGVTLEEWVEALSAELDVEPDVVDVRLLLDVARDAAHQVHRTAGYFRDARHRSLGGGADEVMLRVMSQHEGMGRR